MPSSRTVSDEGEVSNDGGRQLYWLAACFLLESAKRSEESLVGERQNAMAGSPDQSCSRWRWSDASTGGSVPVEEGRPAPTP